MNGAQRTRLADGRLHLHHGPIDLILRAEGLPNAVEAAEARAWSLFPSLLPGLVAELPLLRQAITATTPEPTGPVARRMLAACRPHAARFITPMAAVAGAVADTIRDAMLAEAPLTRLHVNNGGDIAVHLAPDQQITAGLVASLDDPVLFGRITITPEMGVGGVATSGWQGRSFSLGIADAVTVLAANAARADAAATMIANAVTLEGPSITRAPANSLDPDSDLGALPVTIAVGSLTPNHIEQALASGAETAQALLRQGLIRGAVLVLRQQCRLIQPDNAPLSLVQETNR